MRISGYNGVTSTHDGHAYMFQSPKMRISGYNPKQGTTGIRVSEVSVPENED